MKSNLILIAKYLTTETKGKKHGSYSVYRDDKIKIVYDTYYPNVYVYIYSDGEEVMVALISGHGHTQEYHPGHWEKYVTNELLPRALEAKKAYEEKQAEQKRKVKADRFGPVDDSRIFAQQ